MRYHWIGAALLLACGAEDSTPEQGTPVAPPRGFEAPVVVNAESPVAYPPSLFRDGVEGTVILRMFVDETGAVVGDSTIVAESSGYPALDSAALAGVTEMRFAPARRDGEPVPTVFLQPVHFQVPNGSSGGGS
jgi:TonB family protein